MSPSLDFIYRVFNAQSVPIFSPPGENAVSSLSAQFSASKNRHSERAGILVKAPPQTGTRPRPTQKTGRQEIFQKTVMLTFGSFLMPPRFVHFRSPLFSITQTLPGCRIPTTRCCRSCHNAWPDCVSRHLRRVSLSLLIFSGALVSRSSTSTSALTCHLFCHSS
jgi:hypothetical protein